MKCTLSCFTTVRSTLAPYKDSSSSLQNLFISTHIYKHACPWTIYDSLFTPYYTVKIALHKINEIHFCETNTGRKTPWHHSTHTWPCSTSTKIYHFNKSRNNMLILGPALLFIFSLKSLQRRKHSFCLYTKVRLHLQIKIKKSNRYSESIIHLLLIILKHLLFHPATPCPGIRLVHFFYRSFSLTFSLGDHLNSVFYHINKMWLAESKEASVCPVTWS